MHVLFKSIFYFKNFYVIEHIMYFAFNNNTYIYIYIYEKCNLITRFKLHNYNIFYFNGETIIKIIFFKKKSTIIN